MDHATCSFSETSTVRPFMGHLQVTKMDHFTCSLIRPQPYLCKNCDFQTDLKVTLKSHYRTNHQNTKILHHEEPILQNYICRKCKFQTFTGFVFIQHMCKEVIKNEISAAIVDVNTDDTSDNQVKETELNALEYSKQTDEKKEDLATHIEEIIVIPEKPPEILLEGIDDKNLIKCLKCSYTTDKKANLKTHMSRNHIDPDRVIWYECERCPYKTNQKNNLQRHILHRHTDPEDIDWFMCDHCTYKTKKKESLKNHVLWKHTEDIQWLSCEHCSFKTKRKDSLRNHVLCKHTNSDKITWYKCDHCSYKAKMKNYLKDHMIYKHSKQWFKCYRCSYKARQKINLRLHALFHHNPNIARKMNL